MAPSGQSAQRLRRSRGTTLLLAVGGGLGFIASLQMLFVVMTGGFPTIGMIVAMGAGELSILILLGLHAPATLPLVNRHRRPRT